HDRAQAEILLGGGGVDGAALAEEQLGLLVGPLHHQDPGPPAHVEEGEEVRRLETGEVPLQDFFHLDGRFILARGSGAAGRFSGPAACVARRTAPRRGGRAWPGWARPPWPGNGPSPC